MSRNYPTTVRSDNAARYPAGASEGRPFSTVLLILAIFMLTGTPASLADCSLQVDGHGTVNGDQLWSEVPRDSASLCVFNQFAWNNFLYWARNISDTNNSPRLMSMTPWYDLFPAEGKPRCTGAEQAIPLSATQINKAANMEEAGNAFRLTDVQGRFVAYDMRVNQTYCDWVANQPLYTHEAYSNAETAYMQNPMEGGIWLNPGSVEIKTSWRDFGSVAGVCPADLMICQQDTHGHWLGLLGVHLVHKTPQHGEWVWASFEHVANAPDCGPGGSNPIGLSWFPEGNVNKNIPGLKDETGWSLFNYADYKSKNGDGKSCPFPEVEDQKNLICKKQTQGPICLLTPQTKEGWRFVNVCRTDQLPGVAQKPCENDFDNSSVIACLNRHVLQDFWDEKPDGISPAWSFYRLVGTEWLSSPSPSKGLGAPDKGCVNYTGEEDSGYYEGDFWCPDDKKLPHSEKYFQNFKRAGSTNLANTTMETWMQKDICLITPGENNKPITWTQQDCFSCHQPPTTSGQGGGFSHLFGRIQQSGGQSD